VRTKSGDEGWWSGARWRWCGDDGRGDWRGGLGGILEILMRVF
jgi:hypothetical protein